MLSWQDLKFSEKLKKLIAEHDRAQNDYLNLVLKHNELFKERRDLIDELRKLDWKGYERI